MLSRTESEIMATWQSSSTTPVVSICSITYNHEKYISKAIESFLSQVTEFPFEIVIGEDCSTDNTLEIIKSYKAKYPKIIKLVTSNHNVGFVSNFNRVMSKARGEYIAFCEGDDYFITNHKLSLNLTKIKSDQNLNFLFGPAIQHDEINGKDSVRNEYTEEEIKKIDLNWVLKKGGAFYPTATCFYKKSILKNKPSWFDHHCTVDYPLAILAALNNGKIGYINEPTACYRIHDTSFSNMRYDNNSDAKKSVEIKYKTNIAFIDEIYKNNIMDNYAYEYLLAKEDYIYYAKLMDHGFYVESLQGLLDIRYSYGFRIRLLVRLLHKLFDRIKLR